MKKLAALTLSLLLTTGTVFANSPRGADAQPAKATKPAKAAVKTNAQIAKELAELRQSMQTQQEQLQLLKGQQPPGD